jgi:hypothetical protein
VPAAVDLPVPADPVAALAALGVEMPGLLTAHEVGPGMPVWSVPVEPGYPAAELWEAVRAAHEHTGWWPLLTVPDTFRDADEPGIPVPGDGAAWLTEKADILADVPRGGPVEVDASDPDAIDWADALDAAVRDVDRLTLVPAAAGWLVPGRLGWTGACNVDLRGDGHATVLRRWAGRWGAELVGLDLDQMTLRVLDPPADADEALAAAVEAVLYCSDAVFQGVGTLDALAPAMCLPLWRFWWD